MMLVLKKKGGVKTAWKELGMVRFTHLLSVFLNSWKKRGKEVKSSL